MSILFGFLVVVGLFGALIAPYYIDWSVYKRDFEREASRVIGQTVTVGGEAKVRLLPMPGVTFEDLQVGKNEDGSPIATVDEFSLRAELMPFLSGQIRIYDMKLVRPKVQVHVTPDGQIAWTDRKEAVVDPDKVNIENVSVEDGTIIVSGLAGGREFFAEDLFAAISAKTLLGPWKIDASGQVAGVQARWSISTGILQKSGAIRVKLTNEQVNLPYKLVADGPVSLNDGIIGWKGQFGVSPLRDDALARARSASAPHEAYVQGVFEATPKNIDVAEYRLEIGSRDDPYTISGSGGINIGDEVFFNLLADGRQVDLDRLANSDNEQGKKIPIEERIRLLRRVIEGVPVPPINGLVSLELPAIVAGDTLVRKISTRARPLEGGWNIEKFNAVLPGNTLVEAQGRLDLFQDFGFNGNMLVASRQPSGLASWISGDVGPSIRRLKSAGFEANVTLSPNQISLENLELILDRARLSGMVQRLSNKDGRPGIIAELGGEKVNIDDLRAIYALTQGGQGANFSNHDVDFRLRSDRIEGKLFGEKLLANGIDMHLRVQEGSLSLERLNAEEFFGAGLQSVGRVSDLLAKPHGNMKLKLVAENASKLAALALRLGVDHASVRAIASDATLSQNTQLEIELDATSSGGVSNGALLVNGEIGGTNIKSRTGFRGRANQLQRAEYKIVAQLENKIPYALLNQMGLGVLPLDTPGPLGINSEITGQFTDNLKFQINASAPDGDLDINGTAKNLLLEKRQAAFSFDLGAKDFQPFLTLGGFALPGASLLDELPLSVSTKVDINGSDIGFSGLSGQVAGNQISGDVRLKQIPSARPKLFGQLQVDRLSIPVIGDMVYGKLSGGLGQESLDDGDSSFSKALLQGLDGELALAAKVADLGYGDAARNYTSKLAILDGAINLNQTSMNWMGGVLSGNLSLQNSEGTGVVTGQFQLVNGDLDALQKAAGLPDSMIGRFKAGGTFDSTGRSVNGIISGLSGSGIISVKSGLFKGLNANAFSQILLASDADGFEITPERVGEFVNDIVLDQTITISNYSEAFSIVNGNLRLRNVTVSVPGLDVTGQGSIDLTDGHTEAEARLVYQAGKEAVAGAEPEVRLSFDGPLGDLKREINTQGLEGYLAIRAYEREQRRVELLQTAILEKQRLRREIIRTNARAFYRVYSAEQERLQKEKAAKTAAENKILQQEAEKARREAEEIERKRLEKEAAVLRKQQAKEAAEAERKRKTAAEEKRKQQAEAERLAREQKERKKREAEIAAKKIKENKAKAELQASIVKQQQEQAGTVVNGDRIVRKNLEAPKNGQLTETETLDRKLFLRELDELLFGN